MLHNMQSVSPVTPIFRTRMNSTQEQLKVSSGVSFTVNRWEERAVILQDATRTVATALYTVVGIDATGPVVDEDWSAVRVTARPPRRCHMVQNLHVAEEADLAVGDVQGTTQQDHGRADSSVRPLRPFVCRGVS